MKSYYITICAFFLAATTVGQSLNKYEYVIIPAKYEFLKTENQYQLNELTSFLIEKEGFKTVYDTTARSVEFTKDQCAGLSAEVENSSGVFNTKLIVTFRDCNNAVVWKSTEGKSKQKDYKKGYHEALREALLSLKDENYTYNGEKEVKNNTPKVKIAEPIETVTPVKVEESIPEKVEIEEVVEEEVKIEKTKEVLASEKINDAKSYVKDAKENVKEEVKKVKEAVDSSRLLYAQATLHGYQLVDNVPSVAFVMVKSSKEDLYILKNLNGIIYQNSGRWFAEYYQDNKLIKEAIQIKF